MFLQDNQRSSSIARQIVSSYVATEELREDLTGARRTLNLVKSVEDLALIATQVEQLTPEQQALIRINGNLVVAGTDKDATDVIPETISVESLATSSSSQIIETAESFVSMWERLLKEFAVLSHTSQQQINDLTLVNKDIHERSVINRDEMLVRPPLLLLGGVTDIQGLLVLTEKRIAAMTNRLKTASTKVLTDVEAIVNSGLGTFGKTSIGVAKEELASSNLKMNTSADGTVVDVQMPEGYKFNINDNDDVTITKPPVDPTKVFEMDLNDENLDRLTAIGIDTVALLRLSSVAMNYFIQTNSVVGVEFFKNSIQNLLGSSTVIDNLILEYSALFSKVVESVTEELRFMVYISRYAVAVTELLQGVSNGRYLKDEPAPAATEKEVQGA